jgi:hypothetical protein
MNGDPVARVDRDTRARLLGAVMCVCPAVRMIVGSREFTAALRAIRGPQP